MFKIGDVVYFENNVINEDNLLVILSVPQKNGKINASDAYKMSELGKIYTLALSLNLYIKDKANKTDPMTNPQLKAISTIRGYIRFGEVDL